MESNLSKDEDYTKNLYRIGVILLVFSSSLVSMIFLREKSVELSVWHILLGVWLGAWMGGVSSKKWLVER